LIIGIPLSLLVRHKPEQYGYLPDGEQASAAESDSTTVEIAVTEVNIGTKEALKSRAFWHIGIAMTLLFLAISSVIVHVMPYLSSVGVARSSSSLVAMAIPLVSIAGRLSAGWFGDRYRRTRVAAVYIIMVGLGLLLFSFASINRMWLMIPFIMLFGTGWGSNLPIRAALLREYFGRSKLGTIFGFMMGLSAMGAVIGPIFTGWVFDRWESYFAAWLVCAGLAFTAAIILITTPASAANTKEGSITG
jgi:sugar phosphate permease